MSEQNTIYCIRCNKNKIVEDFIGKDDTFLKTCFICREKAKINRIKNKCVHNKYKSNCRECGGSSLCIHNKRKSNCRECGGSAICIHNKLKHRCKECGGVSICIHNKRKQYCLLCGGSAYCEHNKVKLFCRICSDELSITIKRMVYGSKSNDKKYDRYDEKNAVDYDYVKKLIIESNNICCYCNIKLQFIKYANDLATIERVDNSLPHIKGNCKIACRTCNYKKIGDN